MIPRIACALLATALLAKNAAAFYIPGVQPQEFSPGDEVPMKVNAITSIHTQIPKDYYRLPFANPTMDRKWHPKI